MKLTSNKGFTLIELMIVVAILGIVTAVAIPSYNYYVEVGRIDECKREIASIQLAEEAFFFEAGNNNTYFAGPDVATLEANSLGLYTRAQRFRNGTSNCTIAVTQPGGDPTQYVITPTGRNELAGIDLTGLIVRN